MPRIRTIEDGFEYQVKAAIQEWARNEYHSPSEAIAAIQTTNNGAYKALGDALLDRVESYMGLDEAITEAFNE